MPIAAGVSEPMPPPVPSAKKPLSPWAVVGIVAGSGCLLLALGAVGVVIAAGFFAKGVVEAVVAPFSVGESVRSSMVDRMQSLAPPGYAAEISTPCTAINLDCVQQGGAATYTSPVGEGASDPQETCSSLVAMARAASAPGVDPWAGGSTQASDVDLKAICVQQLQEIGVAVIKTTMETPELLAASQAYPEDFSPGVSVRYTLKRTTSAWVITGSWS